MMNKTYTVEEIEKLAAAYLETQDTKRNTDSGLTAREEAEGVLDDFLAYLLPPVPRSEVEALRARIKELEALVPASDDL